MITDIRKNSYSRCADRQKYGQSKTIRNLPHLPIPVRSKSALLWPGVLLLTIILLDQKGKCFAGISMDQVLHYVTDVDYGTYLETWVETAVNGSQAL